MFLKYSQITCLHREDEPEYLSQFDQLLKCVDLLNRKPLSDPSMDPSVSF